MCAKFQLMQKNENKILKIIQVLSLEAKLIQNLVLVEISLGKVLFSWF